MSVHILLNCEREREKERVTSEILESEMLERYIHLGWLEIKACVRILQGNHVIRSCFFVKERC